MISQNTLIFVLSQIFIALLQVFFNLGFSPVFGHFGFDTHFHVNFGIDLHWDALLSLNNFSGSEHYFASSFALNLLFISDTGANGPILVALFEEIPNIDKIPRRDNKHFKITQINNFGVIIGRFYFLIKLVNIGIKTLL